MPEPALPRGARTALVALVLAAVWAFARRHPAAWLAGAAAVVSLFWPARPVAGGRAARAILSTARVAAAAAGVLAFVHTLYPMMSERMVAGIAAAIGFVLAALAGALLLGAGGTAVSGAVVVTAVALLVTASLDPADRLLLPQGLAGAAALAYLVLSPHISGRPRAAQAARVRRAASVTLAGAATVVVAVAIARLLPWAQPQVEKATASLFVPSSGAFAQAGFSETSSLGDIEQLALSRTVVMRVWTPAPRKLRARVLTEFAGRTWRTGQRAGRDVDASIAHVGAGELGEVPGRDFVVGASGSGTTVTRVLRVVPLTEILIAPAVPYSFRADVPRLRIDDAGVVTPQGPAPELYAVVHGGSGQAASDVPGTAALALPPRLDPRIHALANALAAAAPTPRARVDHTLRFLDAEYRYTLAPGRFRTASPLAEFLFEKKKGYCEYFATAAAVLLRLQGVPTRYVTGFAMTDAGRTGGHFVVRESDAHAWIEAWVDGRWIEADPTPAADYDALRAPLREGAFGQIADWVSGRWAEAWMAARFGRRGLMAVAACALCGGVVLAWRRRRSRVRPAKGRPSARDDGPAPELRRLLGRVDAAWAAAGAPRPPHRAPLEHLAVVPETDLPADLRAATRAAVEGYYRARFGGTLLRGDEVAALEGALEGLSQRRPPLV